MQRLAVNTAANMGNPPAIHTPNKSSQPQVPNLRLLGAVFVALPLIASPLPAFAGWKDDFGTLRIGLVSPSGGRGVAGLQEMTTAFEYAAGVPVEILVARDYPSLIRAQIENRIHYAVYSAAAYATTLSLCGCVEPIAAPVGVDSARGVRAVLIARRGVAQSLADIAGLRVAAGPEKVVGPQALALAALAHIRTPHSGGSTIHMASQSEAEQLFLAGEADVLVGWQFAYDDLSAAAPSGTVARLTAAGISVDEIQTIWSSEPIRYGPHAVRSELPQEMKGSLRRFLVNLRDQQPDIYAYLEAYRGGGFAVASATDYAAAEKIVGGLAKP